MEEGKSEGDIYVHLATAASAPQCSRSDVNAPGIPQAAPLTGHTGIVCLLP